MEQNDIINDLPESVDGKSKLFADDSKLLSVVRDENDVNNLQRDLWSICEWSRVWTNVRLCILEGQTIGTNTTWNTYLVNGIN